MFRIAFIVVLLAGPALADVSPFKTPSGNIECYVGTGEGPSDVSCTIFNRSGEPAAPPPANCPDAWGHRFSLTERGPVTMECGAPGAPNTASGVDVAAYGQTATWGGLSCSSSQSGLECSNADGHGFFLSRARQTAY